MVKRLSGIMMMLACAGAMTASAQDILEGKPIYTLGEAKTWTSSNEATYTFVTADLNKLVATPVNTSNVYLFPEAGGGWATEANKEIGIQGFYVDMEDEYEVSVVNTTWEGAAANAYDIYLTNEVPTLDILNTTPAYSASGLGQYQANTAEIPAGNKGRYLVFQPTDATNWGWGVKIRSIQAFAAVENEVLTSFSVAPGLVAINQQTELTMTFKNQLDLDIDASKVSVTVSDNATLENNVLTINSGSTATLSATMDNVTLTAVVYALVTPEVPAQSDIKTPIFTNTVTDYNDGFAYEIGYNGGATNIGKVTFDDGEVAYAFANVKCAFIYNRQTLSSWTPDIDPAADGYRSLHLDIFGTKDCNGYIDFERGDKYNFTLKAGEWTSVDIDLANYTQLHVIGIRFNDDNVCDIAIANVYFTPSYIDGDEEAPVLRDVTATASMTTIEMSFSATDDKNPTIIFNITDGVNNYSTSGKSGEEMTYVLSGLNPSTEYNLTITASDGINVSDPKELTISTLGFPAAPTPEQPADKVVALYSARYNATTVPTFDAWGSSAVESTIIDANNNDVLMFTNYMGQWGGLVNLDLDIMGATKLHMDIFGDSADGTLTIAPVWADANGATTPDKAVTVEADKWNSYDIDLSDFGSPDYGTMVIQLAMTNSTMASFAVDNIYFWTEGSLSSIVGIEADETAATEYYTLQGVRVDNPTTGLYIVKRDNKVAKVIL